MRFPLVLLPAAFALFAQPPQTAPLYTREGLVPLQGNRAKLLAPGMVLELYGQHLAPEPWCGQNAMPPAPYPSDVCGVRVMVGATPAGLMFVGPGQINFKIPAAAPAEGSAPIQVCVRGVCGAPLVMRFSAHKAYLQLHGGAAVHMPVWVDVEAPAPYEFKYPCFHSPGGFQGFELEVRRGAQPLSQTRHPGPPGDCSAAAKPSPMPLHLLYHFSQPGTYSVRLTGPGVRSQAFQSDWTDITVGPETEAARDEWLRSMAEKANSASPETLIGEIIPDLLAWPDEKALAVLLPLLELPAPAGQFARSGLDWFPEDLLRRMISPDRLLNYCSGRCGARN